VGLGCTGLLDQSEHAEQRRCEREHAATRNLRICAPALAKYACKSLIPLQTGVPTGFS